VVWVTFYGVCPKGDIIIFKPTIYANQRELARLTCNTFFHTVAQPGTYKFCATKGKCRTAVLKVGAPYAFRILPTTISYSIAPVSAEEADAEIREQSISPLDPKRFLAPDLVTVDGDKAPPSILVP
jgi:hypothetical protein